MLALCTAQAKAAAPIAFHPAHDKTPKGETLRAVIAKNTPIALTAKEGAIYYTTDGTDPAVSGTRYTAPFTLAKNTVVKAVVKCDGQYGKAEKLEYKVYASPYDISAVIGDASLSADFEKREAQVQTKPARENWYEPEKYRDGVKWGPNPKQLGAPALPENASAQWKRNRVIAAAYRYLNTQYQHHHLPMWDPPQDWPYTKTRLGHQSRGVDCSNFTGWAYNLALGIDIDRAVAKQAKMLYVKQPQGISSQVMTVAERTDGLEFTDLVSKFKTGDLIFAAEAKTNPDKAAHVVLWIGQDTASGDYLVIDSHDQTANSVDAAGGNIPSGVQVRAYRESSWYNTNFVRALRIIAD